MPLCRVQTSLHAHKQSIELSQFSTDLGRICLPAASTGRASLKNSGGSPGSCRVRMVMLMGGDAGGVPANPILWTSSDGSMLPWRMDGRSRYSSRVASNTIPRTTMRLRKKLILADLKALQNKKTTNVMLILLARQNDRPQDAITSLLHSFYSLLLYNSQHQIFKMNSQLQPNTC